jgi:hypothetical protein
MTIKLDFTQARIFVSCNFKYVEYSCNVDGQNVAKQQLGKRTSTIERLFSMGSAPRPLLCNGSVNKFQQ